MVVGQGVTSRFFDFGVVGHSEKLACKVLRHNDLFGVVGQISNCRSGVYKSVFKLWGQRSLVKTGPQSVAPQWVIGGRRSNK